MAVAEQNIRVDEVDAMLLDVLEALFLILFKNHTLHPWLMRLLLSLFIYESTLCRYDSFHRYIYVT